MKTTKEIVDECINLMRLAVDVNGTEQAKLDYMEAKTKEVESRTNILELKRVLCLQVAELAECYARIAMRQLLDRHTKEL